jgi:hypothetical protein
MARATAGVYTDGLDQLIAKVGLVRERLLTPGPALNDIALLFETMEAAVFAGHGSAPEFGINTSWAPWSEATVKRHQYANSGGMGASVLVAYGYLRAAAINPKYGSIDLYAKEITLEIDPHNKGYNRSQANYAAINNQTRPFVQISPVFRIMANEIARNYVLEPFKKHSPLGVTPTKQYPQTVRREGGFKASEHRHNRSFNDVSRSASSKDYANFQHMQTNGTYLDHRTTASRNLQSEYNSVMAGDATKFANNAAYNAAAQRVARFHVSNFDGMTTGSLNQSYFLKANNPL